MLRSIFLLCLILSLFSCKSQQGIYTTTDKKAIKLYQNAKKTISAGKTEAAIRDLEKAVEKAPEFVEALTMLAFAYVDVKQDAKAIETFKKAVVANPSYYRGANVFALARFEFGMGKYEDAKQHYQQYLDLPLKDSSYMRQSNHYLRCCDFAISAIKAPVPFKPVNMGPGINTKDFEYFPTVTADDQLFLFTRNIREVNAENVISLQEDFFYSKKTDGKWSAALSIGDAINTTRNEGAPCLSADGNLLFFVVCPTFDNTYGVDRKGYGSCDIFYAFKKGDQWSKGYNAGALLNTANWETQPSFSSDGRTMYFIRGAKAGDGSNKGDIYMSEITDDGKWTPPLKLGPNVNTGGIEESVFIHPDNQTLYFASDGRVGMGGMDLYMSKRQPNGEWGPPMNLGYPINTWRDENSLLIGGNGEIAYFASDREGGFGGLDLYSFEVDKSIRPERISYMKGKVYDKKTLKPLEANFELIDLETGKFVVRATSNAGNGQFLVTLPPNKNYMLNVSKDGYNFYSENFSFKESPAEKPFMIDVPLIKPADANGEIFELKNVFFETAKFDLRPESKYELDKLATFLEKTPTINIELRGHTDNVGDDKSNLVLSDNRAKAVYDYLIAKKIPKERLSWKGYGETVPKSTNDTPEGRQQNRRTEYKIVVSG